MAQRDIETVLEERQRLLNPNSPDMVDIERKERCLVFAYGTLRYGFPRWNIAQTHGARLLGSGHTEEKFAMYNIKTSSQNFPGLFHSHLTFRSSGGLHQAYGDLLSFPSSAIMWLDRIEGNTFLYQREKIMVSVIVKTAPKIGTVGPRWETRDTEAWCYIAKRGDWYHGTPLKEIKPHNDRLRYSVEMAYDFEHAHNQGVTFKIK